MTKVILSEKLAQFSEHWRPRIVGELNGQHVKVVKFQGEFVWHQHEYEDELFLVLEGRFRMDFRAVRVDRDRGISDRSQGCRTSAGCRGRGVGAFIRAGRDLEHW